MLLTATPFDGNVAGQSCQKKTQVTGCVSCAGRPYPKVEAVPANFLL